MVKVTLTKRGRVALRRAKRVRVQVTTIDAAGNTVQLSNVKLRHGKKR
jgi:hypothetical protein